MLLVLGAVPATAAPDMGTKARRLMTRMASTPTMAPRYSA
jgi:hypothetical protein